MVGCGTAGEGVENLEGGGSCWCSKCCVKRKKGKCRFKCLYVSFTTPCMNFEITVIFRFIVAITFNNNDNSSKLWHVHFSGMIIIMQARPASQQHWACQRLMSWQSLFLRADNITDYSYYFILSTCVSQRLGKLSSGRGAPCNMLPLQRKIYQMWLKQKC